MTVEALQFIATCLDTVQTSGVNNARNLINSIGMMDSLARKMQEHDIKNTNELFAMLEKPEPPEEDDPKEEGEEE